ncbi:MAG: hypothetical protein RBJ76_06385 [Stenomitos frigidus ULC029]
MARKPCHLANLNKLFSVASCDTSPATPANIPVLSRSSSKYGELEPASADASP